MFIVLVEPEEPANIGGVARAMKNTGFGNLVLVKNGPEIPRAAYWVAHASEEILDSAQIYSDFDRAIAGMNLVVGTTQRVRAPYFPVKSPLEVVLEALPVARNQRVAFVFGRESRGLLNRELYRCTMWSRIPSPVSKPAFNLAQAVLIYTYTFFQELLHHSPVQEVELATREEYESFYNRLRHALDVIEFRSKDGPERFIARVRRVLNSVKMERRDLHVLFTLLNGFLKRVE